MPTDRPYSIEPRADGSKPRFSMTDGSYPIDRCTGHDSVESAALLAHHSKTYSFAEVKAHVLKAKAALGCPDSVLPDSWSEQKSEGGPAFERRYTDHVMETRAGGHVIAGYAAKFNFPSNDLGGFVEYVAPTAFNDSRGRGWPNVVARFNHDDNYVLGTTRTGTLRLNVDQVGLNYEVTPPPSRVDILQLVERGDIAQSSFAFRAVQDEWTHESGSFPRRSLVNVQLFDVAPVVTPAYPDTTAMVRSLRLALASLAEQVQADLDEVVALAAEKELRKLFIRTDLPGHPKSRTIGTLLADHQATERNPWANRAR